MFVCLISISFLFGLVCNKRREGYDVILLLFCEVRILIFYVLFFSFFCSCLDRDRPYSSAQGVSLCVCVCVLFPFHFCLVVFVIKEGKGMMLFFAPSFDRGV